MFAPTVRHGADLGYIPVVVADACGAGNQDAAQRSIENLKFAGDALISDTETILWGASKAIARSQCVNLGRRVARTLRLSLGDSFGSSLGLSVPALAALLVGNSELGEKICYPQPMRCCVLFFPIARVSVKPKVNQLNSEATPVSLACSSG